MTEQQAGIIAIIKTAAIAAVMLACIILLGLLALLRDGPYTDIVLNALPALIFGAFATLGGMRVADVAGGLLNNYVASKYQGTGTPNTESSLPPPAPIPVDVSAPVTSGAESQPEG